MLNRLATSYYVTQLPKDPVLKNIPRTVPMAALSQVEPAVFKDTRLIHISKDVARLLGFQPQEWKSKSFQDMVTGQGKSEEITYFAMNYGGHQFGHWAGQLGDGRAINIGQFKTSDGIEQLQLKGAGPTPYSRSGDGFAVLRSSIREHLCSEAMHHLGIPTTRSLSLALSGEQVMRDMFYNGNAAYEKGAVVCRVAPSFLRFGNFELPATRGEENHLKKLVDFTIKNHFPEIDKQSEDKYLQFFQEVTTRTLDLMIQWQRVGFVHGVMNTDNMSILGLTIDYGPYGWLDDFNPNWTPNTTDNQNKRYRYGAQPEIGLWNLWQLANALYTLIGSSEGLESILNDYKTQFQIKHLNMWRSKLGLNDKQDLDDALTTKLLSLLPAHETDMTLFFRELMHVNHETEAQEALSKVQIAFYERENMPADVEKQWHEWFSLYVNRLKKESAFAKARLPFMQRTNPKYVLRNYMAQLAIEDAQTGNYDLLEELHELLKNPYEEQSHAERWYAKRPDWARNKPGSSQLSCSS